MFAAAWAWSSEPHEEPCPTTGRDGSELALAGVIVQAEAAVVEEPAERISLPDRVPESACDGTANAADAFEHALGPGKEFVEHRAGDPLPPNVPLLRSEVGPVFLEFEKGADAQ